MPRPAPRPKTAPGRAASLGPCATCGNVYDKAFEVLRGGKRFVFDSIECAATAIAPTCAHCASHEGAGEMRDRA